MTEIPALADQLARAIYMTHWKPADPDSGRAGSPVWENVSNNVRQWVTAQAESAIAAAENAGYAIVPLEPTPAMLAAGQEHVFANSDAWRAMLAAYAAEG